MFYTLTNLQGSQTYMTIPLLNQKFYTLTNLQGSQTRCMRGWNLFSFTLLQTTLSINPNDMCFTLLQTYKVLKQSQLRGSTTGRFTLLQTYKVLKPIITLRQVCRVLHSYKLTRFSNT